MALPNTYARRKRMQREADQAKIFRTDAFGRKLLTQIVQAITEFEPDLDHEYRVYPSLVKLVREETGQLVVGRGRDSEEGFHSWWFNELPNTPEDEQDIRISAVEWACRKALEAGISQDRRNPYSSKSARKSAWEMIEKINARMMEEGFGFQFENGQMVEVTSQFAHTEIVEPALAILASPIFEGANQEFRYAFDEFKQRNYDDCVADCGNAFESVIKVIAGKRGWSDVSEHDNASKLIEALYRHELIPIWMQEQMKGLRMMLQGAPTVRNKEGGHGAGETPRQVDKHLAAYQLHQTAAAIVFLAESAGLAA
jgi:hypothetical protein